MRGARLFLVILALVVATTVVGQAPPPVVRTVKLVDNLYELTAIADNPIGMKTLALTRRDGVLLVDTALARTAQEVLQAVERLDSGKVRYVINTHLHDDHIGGNAVLASGAIAIFTLNCEEYPGSGNVWDSLGEAIMTAGDKQRAIQCYTKSLKLTPGNSNAVQMLQRLKAGS